jgi:hypothetical protein
MSDVEAARGTLSPDGSTLAVGCSGRLDGICIADAQGTNLRALVSDPFVFGPKWSPDGTRIAYNYGDTGEVKVFVLDVAAGETTFVAEGTFPEWLDDHTLIVEVTPWMEAPRGNLYGCRRSSCLPCAAQTVRVSSFRRGWSTPAFPCHIREEKGGGK